MFPGSAHIVTGKSFPDDKDGPGASMLPALDLLSELVHQVLARY